MFELIVLAQEVIAEAALIHTPPVIPYTSLALDANCIHQWAHAGMRLQTLPAVADPRLAVITDGTNHLQPGGKYARMLHHTVARLQHALLLAALRTDRQPLDTLTEVTECTRFLLLATFLTIHGNIAWLLR